MRLGIVAQFIMSVIVAAVFSVGVRLFDAYGGNIPITEALNVNTASELLVLAMIGITMFHMLLRVNSAKIYYIDYKVLLVTLLLALATGFLVYYIIPYNKTLSGLLEALAMYIIMDGMIGHIFVNEETIKNIIWEYVEDMWKYIKRTNKEITWKDIEEYLYKYYGIDINCYGTKICYIGNGDIYVDEDENEIYIDTGTYQILIDKYTRDIRITKTEYDSTEE